MDEEASNQSPSANEPIPMSYKELFDLFKHFDDSAHKKETLFLGVSLATIPAVFVSWNNLKPPSLVLAALASLACYWLHEKHVARYASSQDAITKAIGSIRTNFGEVFYVPPAPSIRKLRKRVFWGLIAFWSLVFAAKIAA